METKQTEQQELAVSKGSPKKKGWLFILVVTLGILDLGGYLVVKQSTHRNAELNAQVESLKASIKKQININNGVAPSVSENKDPKGGLAMMNGVITFTLPKNWERSPNTFCFPGAFRDSEALCYDVTDVRNANSKFTATISVYARNSTDGTAKQWTENEYGEWFNRTSSPALVDLTDKIVGGNSAISYRYVATPDNPKASDSIVYVVVHGKHAVVIKATLVMRQPYDGGPFDFSQTDQEPLEQFVQSVRFKD